MLTPLRLPPTLLVPRPTILEVNRRMAIPMRMGRGQCPHTASFPHRAILAKFRRHMVCLLPSSKAILRLEASISHLTLVLVLSLAQGPNPVLFSRLSLALLLSPVWVLNLVQEPNPVSRVRLS